MTGAARIRPGLVAFASILIAVLPLHAQQTPEQLKQQAEQILGRPISNQEILQRIRQSGLTPDQIRNRLQQAGYNPSAADAYLNALQSGSSNVPPGTNPMPLVQVLTQRESFGGPGGQGGAGYGQVPPGAQGYQGRYLSAEDTLGPPVFGRDMFRRATSQFQPVTTGPVPPDYRVGPGDQLVLVITGAVEQAYTLTVSREGWVVIPDVGRVYVNGKTMEGLRETLFDRLSQSYSGIKKGSGATTFFDVSVGNLRQNQVYVIGDVEQPSAYTVSSLATALTALYWAGGPTRHGSFRNIVVNRGGGTVAHLDLYDYLIRGDASQDVRLEQGDIVYVPVARKQVRIDGAVNRPGIYEMKGRESLADLIDYAGGVQANAELRRVQIERILPPDQRTAGRDRALLDVPIEDLARAGGPAGPVGAAEPAAGAADSTGAGGEGAEAGGAAAAAAAPSGGRVIPLRQGDQVTVFAVLEDTRNQVTVSGGVWKPGTYAAGDSTRLWDIIQMAGGLLPDAYEGRAQIQRLRPDQTRALIPVSLATDSAGSPEENPRIQGMDQVIVYAERNLREDRAVSIGGWVRYPGVYPFAEGMTVADLILKAGGMRTGAYTAQAEVARVRISQTRSDTLTRRFLVPLDSSYVFDAGSGEDGADGRPAMGGRAATFRLHNLDAVYVRKAPGFEPQQKVVVTGEVQFPGPYSIRTREERLTDLMQRAGGLTDQAYAEGFQLWRAEQAKGADTLTAAEIAGQAVGDTGTGALYADTLGQAGAGGQYPRQGGGQPPQGGGRYPGAQGIYPGAPADTGRVAAIRDSLRMAQQQLEAEKRKAAQSVQRTRVGIDFPRALRNPESSANILVEPGDSIYIPHYVPTVDVEGAVGVQTKVLFREGEGAGYYIKRAGGYAQNADKDRTRIRFANGEVATRGGKFLFFGGGLPDPDPGSTITVPSKPPKQGGGIQLSTFIGILTSIATTAATVIIAAKR